MSASGPNAEAGSADAWYAVHVTTGKEAYAASHLVRQSFEVFVPQFEKTIRHARRLIGKRAAFFPGYVFVRFDASRTRWRAINGTRGVKSLVMTGDRPAPVAAGVMEALRSATNARGLIERDGKLSSGDNVRLLSGPFADLPALVQTHSGADRVRVLVELLNGQVPVVLKRSGIVRISQPGSGSGTSSARQTASATGALRFG